MDDLHRSPVIDAMREVHGTDQLSVDELVEGITDFYDLAGFSDDAINGFQSGLEAVLGTTDPSETEDLDRDELAAREAHLHELRIRIARALGFTVEGK